MPYVSDAPEQVQTISEQPVAEVKQPRHSLFHTIATLLGVNPASAQSHHYNKDQEFYPPDRASDLMASRYPYFYFESLSR